jgi:ABC-type glycerol-3-phosphate transport system substrate-binding protein
MKKYPEITIEATFQGNYTEMNKKVMAAIAAKTPPDAAVGYPSMFSDYKTANAIVELDPYINDPKIGFTAEDLKDVFPAFMEECKFPQYGNKFYAFPFTKSALGMYYNLDLIKAAGFSAPPKTWKEFEEQCLAITKKTGKKAYAYKDDASTVDGFFFSRGVYQLNPDQTKAIFNGPEHVESLAMVKRLFDAGAAYKPEGANADQAAFGKGDVAFTFGSTSGLFYYKQAVTTSGNLVKEWGHTIIPQTDPKNAKTVLYGGSFVVFKSTDIKQKAAWLFLKYFTSTEVTAKWGSQSGYFPVRASAASLLKDYFAKDPIAKEQWETIVPFGYPEPSVRGEQSIRDYLVEAITASNEGVKTTKQALDDAIKKADDALAKGRQ